MRPAAIRLASLGFMLAACSIAGGPPVDDPPASGAPAPTPAVAPCAGRSWPPYAVGSIPGITALATDRATIDISNRTGDTVYYRVSGWEPARLETCVALVEVEVQRGPLAPGTTERVVLDAGWQAGVPVTVAFWDAPCGEACAREPAGSVIVELPPIEPPGS